MISKDDLGYRTQLRSTAERGKMSHIERQCQSAYEERIAVAVKTNLKAHHSYVQSRAASQTMVGGVKPLRS